MIELISGSLVPSDLLCGAIVLVAIYQPAAKRYKFPLRLAISLIAILFFNVLLSLFSVWLLHILTEFVSAPLAYAIQECAHTSVVLCILVGLHFFCYEGLSPQALSMSAIFSYLAQDIAYSLFILIFPAGDHRGDVPFSSQPFLIELLVSAVVYALAYFYLVFKRKKEHSPQRLYSVPLVFSVISILAGRALDCFIKASSRANILPLVRLHTAYHILYSLALIVLLILIQERENYRTLATTELQLRQNLQNQMQAFQKNSETMNHKYHDLKHMVAALRAETDRQKRFRLADNLEENVNIFDTRMRTNDAVLNIILTDTMLNCDKLEIQWTCLADGSALSFMDSVDLCRLMGNALDNAVESVSKIHEKDKRFLAVNIWKKGSLAFIKIENYCNDIPEFKDGMPVSKKLNKQEHGYGTKSIKMIVEDYGGLLKMAINKDVFSLNIMFPIPADFEAYGE